MQCRSERKESLPPEMRAMTWWERDIGALGEGEVGEDG